MNHPMFVGVTVRCPKHTNKLLKPGQRKCTECERLDVVLNLKPPFRAKCKRDIYNKVEKGEIYMVRMVLRDASSSQMANDRGYLLRGKDDGYVVEYVFNAEDFIPEINGKFEEEDGSSS